MRFLQTFQFPIFALLLPFAVAQLSSCAAAPRATIRTEAPPEQNPLEHAPYRGWRFIVEKLQQRGVPHSRLEETFNDPRMPAFSLITFKLKPIEVADSYKHFRSAEKLKEGREFLARYASAFRETSARFDVTPAVITAILLVETHFGENTGKELVLNRLARVSSVGEPDTLWKNYERLNREDPSITIDQVRDRAAYLEDTFLPEVVALFTMTEREHIDIFSLRGSIAGAFGIPQFLPSSYLNYGADGNGDSSISLFNILDAIASTASFLHHYGWQAARTEEQRRAVVWNYNHSNAYVDTIFWLANGMLHQGASITNQSREKTKDRA